MPVVTIIYIYIDNSHAVCLPSSVFLHAVTHGSQWSRLPWGSIPTLWTLTLLEWTYLNATWMIRDACTVTDSSAQSGASQVLCERSVTSTLLYSHLCWKSVHALVQEYFSADTVINVFTDTRNQSDAHICERTLYSQPRWKEDGAVFNKCKHKAATHSSNNLTEKKTI